MFRLRTEEVVGVDTQLLETVARRAAGQMDAENFPVALRLLPAAPRDELTRLYRFARFVDDVGDETPGGPTERLALLDAVADDVRRLGVAGSSAPELRPVADLVPLVVAGRGGSGRVPVQPFLDLVEANRVDQQVSSYADFDALLGYCALSAAPVGRVVLHVADAATSANVRDSDSVCAALQVLEHCQDVGEDARAGRVYLPQDDLAAEGADPASLTGAVTPAAVRAAVSREVGRSRELLLAGPALVARLHGWARIAVAGYVAGGLATADALDAAHYDVLARAVRPSKARTLRHVVTLLAGAARAGR